MQQIDSSPPAASCAKRQSAFQDSHKLGSRKVSSATIAIQASWHIIVNAGAELRTYLRGKFHVHKVDYFEGSDTRGSTLQ